MSAMTLSRRIVGESSMSGAKSNRSVPYVDESLARGLMRQFSRYEGDELANGKTFLGYLRRSGNLLRTRRRPPRPFLRWGTDVDYVAVTDVLDAPPQLVAATAHLDKHGAPLIDRHGALLIHQMLRVALIVSCHACQRVLLRQQLTTASELKREFKDAALGVIDMGESRRLADKSWLVTPHGAGPAFVEYFDEELSDEESPTFGNVPYLVLKTWLSDRNLMASRLGEKRLEAIEHARKAGQVLVDLSHLIDVGCDQ